MSARFNISINRGFSIYCGVVNIKDKSIEKFFRDEEVWKKITTEMGDNIQKALPDNILKPTDLSDENRKSMLNSFYEGLINSMYPDKDARKSKCYKHIRHYSLPINQTIELTKDTTTHVLSLEFYIMSDKYMIFAIDTSLDGLSLNRAALQNNKIRSLYYKSISAKFLSLFNPVIALFNYQNKQENIPLITYKEAPTEDTSLNGLSNNVFIGNKLKTFMFAQLPEELEAKGVMLFDETYSLDMLLHEFATGFGKLGTMANSANRNYPVPDEKYFKQLVEENSIALYANWRSLALYDSVITIMTSNDTDSVKYLYNDWRNEYFRYLYLNALYINTYLTYINQEYKRKDITPDIETEFIEFDKTFNFHSVGHSFLPDIIYKKMRHGLEIDRELKEIDSRISHMAEKMEKKREKRINIVLFILTAMSIFSAFNDGYNLFDISNCKISDCTTGVIIASVLVLGCVAYWWNGTKQNIFKPIGKFFNGIANFFKNK